MAVALETVQYVKTKYQNTYGQKNIIGLLKSIMGDVDVNEPKEFSWWEKPEKSKYKSKLANMLPEYILNRIVEFEREQKTNEEIIDWLRRMAK